MDYKKYIDKFETAEDIQTAIDNRELNKPYVALIESGNVIDWNSKDLSPDYSTLPLTFEIVSGGTLVWRANDDIHGKTIQYSKNDGEWTSITATSVGVSIDVVAGDKIRLKGTNAQYNVLEFFNTYSSNFDSGSTTASFNIYGNIMSLVYGDNFIGQTALTENRNFLSFFSGLQVISAENLVLPATTIGQMAYYSMFADCTSLTKAPKILSVVTFTGNWSCGNMFRGCTSLTTAPALPATTLNNYCYGSMFSRCTELTEAPELPATALSESCYGEMFRDCTNLNYVKCLATDISARNCTNTWLKGVSSSGTFVKDANMTGWTTGTSGIPENWTVVDAS